MKASRSILLLFFWPVLLVLLVAIILGYWSLNTLKATYHDSHQLQFADIKVVQDSARFGQEIGALHQRVAAGIDDAISGKRNEVQLYFLHSDIVNQLAELNDKVNILANSELLHEVNHGSVMALREQFNEYRRFMIMATDIIAIDPNVAQNYVQQAQRHFIEFSVYTQRITQKLAERAEIRSEEANETLNAFFHSVIVISLSGILIMLLLALVSATWVSRHILTLADALSQMANSHDNDITPMPKIEQMHKASKGEFSRIAGALLNFRNAIIKRKQAEAEAFHLAFYDPLTQLPNRRLLLERLQHSQAVTERVKRHGALLHLDLDNFKSINDSEGYSAGDELLIQVAQRLQSTLTEGNTLARVGGDEFIIILESLNKDPNVAARDAKNQADDLRRMLNEPFIIDQQPFFCSPSIGIVLFKGMQIQAEDLLKHADTAMHDAKELGRNTLSFYDPNVQSQLEKRARLDSEMRVALAESQFELHYQPQIDQNKQLLGVEALIRWHHPERGMISPGEFIPVAESSGLIIAISEWVLNQACEQLKLWQTDPLLSQLSISINISARHFKESDFVTQVTQALARTQAPTDKLKIEITESTIVEDVQQAINKMKAVQMLGVTFALDDFGTGYSSLQYLKRLPLNQIKIDQSFVRDLESDADDRAIVKTIIGMGQVLGLSVIAEGVETPKQQQILIKKGCHQFQGYLFSKPLPLTQLQHWVNDSSPQPVN